ncbi:MAG: sigma-70 family RNA polymerase sigma factor [Verrucomicrobiaceae bacterium]
MNQLAELSDEELLQHSGRGDTRAFDRLQDALAPRIFGMLKQMMHDEREAEEILVDGFVQLWEQASTFDPARHQAFPWVIMLFRHKAIERMRALGRRNRRVDSSVLQEAVLLPKERSDDDADTSDDSRHGVVRAALQEVPPDQRRLIECAFLKGVTHHIASESLGIPVETVRSNIRRGLLRLRDLLKGGRE